MKERRFLRQDANCIVPHYIWAQLPLRSTSIRRVAHGTDYEIADNVSCLARAHRRISRRSPTQRQHFSTIRLFFLVTFLLLFS